MFNFRLLKYIYIRIYVLNKMEDESDSDSSVDENSTTKRGSGMR